METLIKLRARAQSDIAGIISALLCALVAWTWEPLMIAAIYLCLFLWDLGSYYFEMKRQMVRKEFAEKRKS